MTESKFVLIMSKIDHEMMCINFHKPVFAPLAQNIEITLKVSV